MYHVKDFTSFTSDIIALITYSKKIENNWKKEDFKLLDKPDEMLYGAVQDFQELLFAEGNEKLYDNIIRISEEMLKNYPDHLQSRLNISTIYIARNDYDKSLDALQKAEKIDSTNPILLYNIASVYKMKGEKENAKKYFALTTRNTTQKEEKLKEAALKQLDLLK